MRKNKPLSKIKRIGLVSLVVMLVLGGLFMIYASDYYRADETAINILENNSNIKAEGEYIVVESTVPTDIGLVFYPGAKVEDIAYLPILNQLAEKGITSILINMPFNMAIFDKDAATEAMKVLPNIKKWYIAGHSMGGAMASQYATENPDKVEGLILLGAYRYGEYPVDKTITIYGSFNDSVEKHIDYKDNIVVIDGGNHAQFGNYGKQEGDKEATISREQQQKEAVEAILNFIK